MKLKKRKILKLLLALIIFFGAFLAEPEKLCASSDTCIITESNNAVLVGTTYPSVEVALETANGTTSIIRMLADDFGSRLPSYAGSNLSLYTNGYILEALCINHNGGSLTIFGDVSFTMLMNPISVDNGKLTINGNVNTVPLACNHAVMVFNSAEFKLNGNLSSGHTAINVYSNSQVIISGDVNATKDTGPDAGIMVSGNSYVEIKGKINITADYGVSISPGCEGKLGSIQHTSSNAAIAYAVYVAGMATINGNVITNAHDGVLAYGVDTEVFVNGTISAGNDAMWVGITPREIKPYPSIVTVSGKKYFDYNDGGTTHIFLLVKATIRPTELDKYTEGKITFTPLPTGEKYYQIYRSISKNKGFKLIGTTVDDYFIDSSLKPGTTYYYKVRTYKLAGKKKVYGKFSAIKTISTEKLPQVNDVTLDPAAKGFDVTWPNVNKMTAIQIYYTNTNTKKTKWKVMNISQTNFYLGRLAENKKYHYKVRYVYTRGGTYYGPFTTVTNKDTLSGFEPSVSDSYVQTTTSYSFPGAPDFYQIQRSLKKDKGFQTIATTDATSYDDYYLKAGTTYYYRVRAASQNGKNIVYGKYSNVIPKPTTALPVPVIGSDIIIIEDKAAINLAWDNNDNMTALQIAYATSDTKKTKWKVITVGPGEFSLRKLASNKKYYLKLRYVYYKGAISYGAYSTPEYYITD